MIDIKFIESVVLPLIYISIFSATIIILWLMFARFRQLSTYANRIATLPVAATYRPEKNALTDQIKLFFNQFVLFMNKLFVRFNLLGGLKTKKLSQQLAGAGWRSPHASTLLLLARIGMACITGITCLILNKLFFLPRFAIDQPALFGITGLLLGIYLTDWYVKQSIAHYRQHLQQALPDALELMVICFEAGYSNDHTIQKIAQDFSNHYPELANELFLTASELKVLSDRKQAWNNFAQRTELPEIHAIVSALQQNDRYGTPMAQALKTQIEIFRRDRIIRAERKAAKLPVLLAIPLTVCFLPTLFVIILSPALIRLFGYN